MEVVDIKKLLVSNLLIYIYLHWVRSSSWCATMLATLANRPFELNWKFRIRIAILLKILGFTCFYNLQENTLFSFWPYLDVSTTTPLWQLGFRQCSPFSWTTLRDKHCRHPIAVMGVLDTFGLYGCTEQISFSVYSTWKV